MAAAAAPLTTPRAAGQLPYVDAFRLCRIDTWPRGDFARSGDVRWEVDRGVGRPVVRLAGAVPGANTLALPALRSGCLSLTGRFLYIQMQLAVGKTYAIHIEFATADNNVHRLTISNLCKQDEARVKRSGIQVHMPATDDGWQLLALDMCALAQQGCRAAFTRVKAVQLCANMSVRSVFSSSLKHSWESLPRDLAFTASFNACTARVVWVPEEPITDVQLAAPKPRPSAPLPSVPRQPAVQRKGSSAAAEAGLQGCSSSLSEELEGLGFGLDPNPVLELQHMNAFTGEFSRSVLWAHDEVVFPAGSAIVAMQAGSGRQRHLLGHARPVVALALDAAGSVLASAEEGGEGGVRLWDLASGTCFATLVTGHNGGVACLDVSPDGSRLAAAGMGAHGRQVLVLYDVSQCRVGSKAVELARQPTEYNVKCLKFLRFEPDKLLACGKNSIRVYRAKDGQLRGMSVPMEGVQALRKPYSCGTLADPGCAKVGEVFTDIAFEHNPALLPVATRRAYVCALSGALYQVNLDMRVIEAVHQLHTAAVGCASLRHGFCATGCAQGLLRVWGLDFEEPFLEVQLEGPVTGVAFSPDGLQIAAGTEVGTLGILSVADHKQSTVLHSHTGSVHAVAVEPSGQQFYTASADGTMRGWDSATRRQLLEFYAPGEHVLSLACHPTKPEVACGFESGTVRVFDVAGAALAQEFQQHSGPVRQVLYAQRGQVLLSAGEDGTVCAYDARRAYLPLRYLPLAPGLAATCIAVSPDGHHIAAATRTSSGGQAGITLFAAASLGPVLQFPAGRLSSSEGSGSVAAGPGGGLAITHLHFLPDGRHLLGVTADGRLLGHRCSDGALVACVPRLHAAGSCTAAVLDRSGTFLVTGGADGLIKVWGLHALHHTCQLGSSGTAAAAGDCEAAGDGEAAGAACSEAVGAAVKEAPSRLRPVRALPCQAFRGHPHAVLGMAFLGGGELLSVGEQDSLCFWSFQGQGCNAYPPAPRDATTSAVVVAQLGRGGQAPAGLPAPAPAALAPHNSPLAPLLGREARQASGGPPAAGKPRPRRASSSAALELAAAAAGQQQQQQQQSPAVGAAVAATVGARPKSGSRSVPLWERAPPGPCTLQVTAGPTTRRVQAVPLQRELVVTASGAAAAGGGNGSSSTGCSAKQGRGQLGAGHTAEWAWREQPAAPAYHPEDNMHLMPPEAALRHVYGFTAAAGFGWDAALGGVVYAAGNALLVDSLGREQRLIALHAGRITAVASSATASWLAAATEPVEGGTADICVYAAAGGERRCVLSGCHQTAVRLLVPSPDGCWLVSLGSASQQLALWELGSGELVAVGEDGPGPTAPEAAPTAVAWLRGAQHPTFYTAGPGGLTRWALGPAALAAEQVLLPEAVQGGQLRAVACCGGQRADGGCCLALGDSNGRVWMVEVSPSQEALSFALLAELQGEFIATLHACGSDLVAAGTAGGTVAVLQRQQRQPERQEQQEQLGGSEGGDWELAGCHRLDGRVLSLTTRPDGQGLLAATEASTLWLLSQGAADVVLSGHRHPITGLQHCADLLATSSQAGVHVWQMDEHGGNARAPLVEFCEPAGASCVSVAHNRSCAAAGHDDGSVSLYDLQSCRLRWRAAPMAQQPVVGVAVLERLRAIRVMVVYRSGALYVLDGQSGKLLQHSLQYAVPEAGGQEAARATASRAGRSHNSPLTGLAVCPGDSTLLALLGPGTATVCKATWAKHSGCQTLGRLQPAGQAPDLPASPTLAEAAPAIAFSSAHPGHAYCAFPSHHQPATIQLHDCASGSIIKTISLAASAGPATVLAASPGDRLLAAGSAAGTVRLLRGDTEAWSELAGHGAPVRWLAFSRCGRKLYSAAGSAIFVWDLRF